MPATLSALMTAGHRLCAPLVFWALSAAAVFAPLQFHHWRASLQRDAREQRTMNNAVTALSRWHAAHRLTFRPTHDGNVVADLRVPAAEWSALTRAEQDALQRELRRFVLHGVRVNCCVIHCDVPDGA